MNTHIAVIAEHTHSRINPVTYEAMACAREITKIAPSKVIVVVVGKDSEQAGREIAACSGSHVLAVKVAGLAEYNPDAFRSLLPGLLAELDVGWVCIPGTSQGMDFGPGLAARLGRTCLSGVDRVAKRDGQPVVERRLLNGKIIAELSCPYAPAVLLVQPGAFRPVSDDSSSAGEVQVRIVDWQATRTQSLGLKNAHAADSSLSEASVIVAAGRGVGREENLELVHRVAGLFARSAMAGSRPLCDLGWLPYQLQVGQTGATVTPELYMACGISGAQQHLAGMAGAKFIVAVNTDPNAAIFNAADVGVVDDLEGFLSDLLEESACSEE